MKASAAKEKLRAASNRGLDYDSVVLLLEGERREQRRGSCEPDAVRRNRVSARSYSPAARPVSVSPSLATPSEI